MSTFSQKIFDFRSALTYLCVNNTIDVKRDMKRFAFIMALFISYLSCKPCGDLFIFASSLKFEQGIVASHQIVNLAQPYTTDQDADDHCDSRTCNPFQSCCAYVYLCYDFAYSSLTANEFYSEISFLYKSVFISQYNKDFWHPPQLS